MENLQPIIAQIAGAIRNAAPGVGAGMDDTVLAGGAVGGAVLVLILLIAILGALGGKKKQREEEAPPPRAERRAEAPRAGAKVAAPAAPRPDPVEKMRADASANAARVKGEADALFNLLSDERDRVAAGGKPFAQVIPTKALRILAERRAEAGEPALAAAKRKVQARDLEGARAELRRHVEGAGSGNPLAWRDAGVLECLDNVENALAALQASLQLDARQFVTQVTIRRLYSGTGKHAEARSAAEAAIALAGSERERAISFDELGESCLYQKDRPAAVKAFQRGLDITKGLAARAPDDIETQRDLAVGYFKLASVAENGGREELVQSIAAFEKLKARGAIEADDEQALAQLKGALADIDKRAAGKPN